MYVLFSRHDNNYYVCGGISFIMVACMYSNNISRYNLINIIIIISVNPTHNNSRQLAIFNGVLRCGICCYAILKFTARKVYSWV